MARVKAKVWEWRPGTPTQYWLFFALAPCRPALPKKRRPPTTGGEYPNPLSKPGRSLPEPKLGEGGSAAFLGQLHQARGFQSYGDPAEGSLHKVVFEVAFNSARGGYVAIDDISFSPEFCHTDTEPNFDPSIANCDFEDGLCLYHQEKTDSKEWSRVSVKPNAYRIGDHTTGVVRNSNNADSQCVSDQLICFCIVSAIAAEVKAPPSVEFVAQVVPDVAAMFVLPPAGPPEVVPQYHSPAPAADAQMFQPIAQPPPVKPPSPPPKPQPVYSNEEIVAELDSVVEEVVGAAVMEVAEAGASYATTALMESGVQVESLLGEVLGQMLQEVSSTEIRLEQQRVTEEKRKLDEARRKQEHEAFLVDFSFSLCSELIYEVLDETIKETATSEIKEAVNEKADRVAKCTEQVCTSLVEDTLDADIARLVEAILEDELQCIHKYIKR
ncbi:uncharacterized protein [Notothenia coriiceps]|uniref:MAM domain-containing protein n=1 Tax=Notothenia coriiceps TaxID=8208 RepID=A0A6I9NJJ4_9TELE|nr:PREDICTED: uncharacterized protein LOC104951714 [Notothenia coriiceps]